MKYTADINRHDDGWRLAVNFSDNKYMMYKINSDIIELEKTRAILDNRHYEFITHRKNTLKTSDLGFEYVLKSSI
jgi:hypothetical protein